MCHMTDALKRFLSAFTICLVLQFSLTGMQKEGIKVDDIIKDSASTRPLKELAASKAIELFVKSELTFENIKRIPHDIQEFIKYQLISRDPCLFLDVLYDFIPQEKIEPTLTIVSARLSPSGRYIATLSDRGIVTVTKREHAKVTDNKNGEAYAHTTKVLSVGQNNVTTSMIFDSNDRLITGHANNEACIWNLEDFEEPKVIKLEHPYHYLYELHDMEVENHLNPVYIHEISPCGKYLATSCSLKSQHNNGVYIWPVSEIVNQNKPFAPLLIVHANYNSLMEVNFCNKHLFFQTDFGWGIIDYTDLIGRSENRIVPTYKTIRIDPRHVAKGEFELHANSLPHIYYRVTQPVTSPQGRYIFTRSIAGEKFVLVDLHQEDNVLEKAKQLSDYRYCNTSKEKISKYHNFCRKFQLYYSWRITYHSVEELKIYGKQLVYFQNLRVKRRGSEAEEINICPKIIESDSSASYDHSYNNKDYSFPQIEAGYEVTSDRFVDSYNVTDQGKVNFFYGPFLEERTFNLPLPSSHYKKFVNFTFTTGSMVQQFKPFLRKNLVFDKRFDAAMYFNERQVVVFDLDYILSKLPLPALLSLYRQSLFKKEQINSTSYKEFDPLTVKAVGP